MWFISSQRPRRTSKWCPGQEQLPLIDETSLRLMMCEITSWNSFFIHGKEKGKKRKKSFGAGDPAVKSQWRCFVQSSARKQELAASLQNRTAIYFSREGKSALSEQNVSSSVRAEETPASYKVKCKEENSIITHKPLQRLLQENIL